MNPDGPAAGGGSASSLFAFLRAPRGVEVAELLSEAVIFHSPVADHRGREVAAPLLTTVASILADLESTRVVTDGTTVTTFLTASVEGRALDGVLDERRDTRGRVVEATLLLRPHAHLRIGIERMQAARLSQASETHVGVAPGGGPEGGQRDRRPASELSGSLEG